MSTVDAWVSTLSNSKTVISVLPSCGQFYLFLLIFLLFSFIHLTTKTSLNFKLALRHPIFTVLLDVLNQYLSLKAFGLPEAGQRQPQVIR